MINGFQNVANLTGGTGRELHTFEELVQWIEDRKRKRHVSISRVPLRECAPWYYDGDSGMYRIGELKGSVSDAEELGRELARSLSKGRL